MGTYMKLHVEKRVGGKWVHVPDPKAQPKASSRSFRSGPSDWHTDRQQQDYDLMAFLVGTRNYDHFKPVAEWRSAPEDLSEELMRVAENHLDGGPTWILVSEIRAYDLDQKVSRPARLYSVEELAEKGWLGNRDGKPYLDISRRGYDGEIEQEGYTLQEFPIRQFVEGFIKGELVEIEEAAGVPPEDIRLVLFFE